MTDMKYILVAEDDPILKNLLGHTFAGKYQTLYANEGQQALELYEQHKPSVILLDLMMPGMDGFAFLEKLRSRTDEGKTVPVIIVSNLGQEADKQKALTMGANEYLVKADVDVDEIVKHMERLMGAQQIANADTPPAPPVPPVPPVPPAPPAPPAPPVTPAS